jgi:hypothetical protein
VKKSTPDLLVPERGNVPKPGDQATVFNKEPGQKLLPLAVGTSQAA